MRARFIADGDFARLELEHWSLVGRIYTGDLKLFTNVSLWQHARIGADIKPLLQAMCDGINKALSTGPILITMTEEGLTALAGPADELVREWMDKWVHA